MREKRNAMKDKFCLGEASRCLLCENAPCSAACSQGDPARMLRAIRFDNYSNARKWIDRCTDEELEKAEKTASITTVPSAYGRLQNIWVLKR